MQVPLSFPAHQLVQIEGHMQINEIIFEAKTVSQPQEPPTQTSKNLKAADFKVYLDHASLAAFVPATSAQLGAAKPLSLKEEYATLLPDLGGVAFGPPVAHFDVGIELKRLAKVELKVEAMEAAGEIDKALDAFIGIHGLKDRITRVEKAELRDRIKELTKAVLLEDEWREAYLGAMKKRIDVSMDGLREFLLGDEGKARMVDANQEMPLGDPDLMSFIRDSTWNDFNPPEYTLQAKADQMILEARRERELVG